MTPTTPSPISDQAAGEPNWRTELSRIAEDYQPNSASQAILALEEMRQALRELLESTAALDIKALANRFLAWRLPQTVCADLCATNNAYQFPRSGTNLLNAEEAEAMFRHVLADCSTAPTNGSALEPVLRCACGNIAEPRDSHVDALRCKSCWAKFAALPANPAASVLTDAQIVALADRYCFTTTGAGGWIFDRDRGHLIAFARALLAASMGGDKA
jgi:hypothetical protein